MVLPYYLHYDPRLTRCPKRSLGRLPSLPRVLAYSQAKVRSGSKARSDESIIQVSESRCVAKKVNEVNGRESAREEERLALALILMVA